ncbi:nucleoside phosphorylase [Legionella impletisoli]|uniref:Uridine phosphorylase n=1 Tax=Legionella impletisoli TaxID=343510 RepID=A0A917JPZ8_9GAMM|nr:nucleoside phosphorylase [Legionella impletisoli]GGI77881.1 phosphorylase [Legionella impletisoli]
MYKPADLPLNQRGAVYHLDLLPEELADTVITVGDPSRVQLVSQRFDRVEITRMHREFVTHTGYLGEKRITVLSTGIGVPNIDIVINELDALANIDLKTRTPRNQHKTLTIIRLGTTGGLDHACVPGDVYISRYAIGFGTLLNYYQHQPSATLKQLHANLQIHLESRCGLFYLAEADADLFEQFVTLGAPSITATCNGFYGPQGRRLRIPLAYPDLLDKLVSFEFEGYKVLNFEMETAGILGLGRLFGHRCLSLSVVLANRMTGEFSEQVNEKVVGLIDKALPLL